ncbi:MAG: sigma-70 family RNA polymerase sigma factor [Acidobacteriota bacterium]
MPDPPRPPADITALLTSWADGEHEAEEDLLTSVYDQLHAMAARYLRGERKDHTLQATALVHEAYLRLVNQDTITWEGRSQFFAIAATMMRRILVDHARKRAFAKRGGGAVKISLDDAGDLEEETAVDLVALDEALQDLARLDRDRATLVELRFFAGLSLEETAEVLGISRATVVRQWRVARAWLFQQLSNG